MSLRVIANLIVLACVFLLSELAFPEWHRHIPALIGISLPFVVILFVMSTGGMNRRGGPGC
jgi:hypothetical protein